MSQCLSYTINKDNDDDNDDNIANNNDDYKENDNI